MKVFKLCSLTRNALGGQKKMTLQRNSPFSLSYLFNGYVHKTPVGILALSVSDISVPSTKEEQCWFFFPNH